MKARNISLSLSLSLSAFHLMYFKALYWRSQKFCNILLTWATIRQLWMLLRRSMKLTNHTRLWDAELDCNSLDLPLCLVVWPRIPLFLVNLTLLDRTSCNPSKISWIIWLLSHGCFWSIMVEFKLIKYKFLKSTI